MDFDVLDVDDRGPIRERLFDRRVAEIGDDVLGCILETEDGKIDPGASVDGVAFAIISRRTERLLAIRKKKIISPATVENVCPTKTNQRVVLSPGRKWYLRRLFL